MHKLSKHEKLQAFNYAERQLNDLMFQKQEIYSIIRHVSSSGMTRHISFFIIDNLKEPNRILFIDNLISDYLDYKPNSSYTGLVVRGCGMDMAFSVVNHLQVKTPHQQNTDFIDYDFRSRII